MDGRQRLAAACKAEQEHFSCLSMLLWKMKAHDGSMAHVQMQEKCCTAALQSGHLTGPQNPVAVPLGRSCCQVHLIPVFNLLEQHHLRGAWCVYAFPQELQIKGFWDLAGNVSGNTRNDIFSCDFARCA